MYKKIPFLKQSEFYSQDTIKVIKDAKKYATAYNDAIKELQEFEDVNPQEVGGEKYVELSKKRQALLIDLPKLEKAGLEAFIGAIDTCYDNVTAALEATSKESNERINEIVDILLKFGCSSRFKAEMIAKRDLMHPTTAKLAKLYNMRKNLADNKVEATKRIKQLEN